MFQRGGRHHAARPGRIQKARRRGRAAGELVARATPERMARGPPS